MIRSATTMLGVGLLAVGMSAPLAARAEENALALVIGAAAAHALHDDERQHIRHPHRRDVVPVHRSWDRDRHWRTERWSHRDCRHGPWPHRHGEQQHWKQDYWRQKHWQHKQWHAKRWDRYDRRHDRHDRRQDRRDWRHDGRDWRHDGRDWRHDDDDRWDD